jgi:hypothetical protein
MTVLFVIITHPNTSHRLTTTTRPYRFLLALLLVHSYNVCMVVDGDRGTTLTVKEGQLDSRAPGSPS